MASADGKPQRMVAFVSNELGSFRHHREHLARAVQAAGGRAVLLATPAGGAPPPDYEFRPLAINRFRFDAAGDFGIFATVLRLALGERPAALHLINLKPYLYGGLAVVLARLGGWKGRVVFTVPGLGRLYDDDAGRKGSRAWLRRHVVEFFLRIAASKALVTFETERDRDIWLARGLVRPQQATVTRGTGIDLARFGAGPGRGADGRLRVLFAGRLLRAKGLDVFLEAAGQVGGDGIEMLVAGAGEDDPDAIRPETLRDHGAITFLGPVADMPLLLAGVDVVVLASRYNEGVPRILIEAAATGCVPVATEFAGSRKLIVDGETGYFLKSGLRQDQAVELAALLRRLTDEPQTRRQIGDRAARHVRDHGFSAEEIAAVFLKLYGLA